MAMAVPQNDWRVALCGRKNRGETGEAEGGGDWRCFGGRSKAAVMGARSRRRAVVLAAGSWLLSEREVKQGRRCSACVCVWNYRARRGGSLLYKILIHTPPSCITKLWATFN